MKGNETSGDIDVTSKGYQLSHHKPAHGHIFVLVVYLSVSPIIGLVWLELSLHQLPRNQMQ